MKTLLILGALALAGCSTAPRAPKIEPYTPPAVLLQPCPTPQLPVQTNGQLAGALLATQEALRQCNQDKTDLRSLYSIPESVY